MRVRPTPEQRRALQELSFNALIGSNQLARQIGSFGLARLIPPPAPSKLLVVDEAWLFLAPRRGDATHHHIVVAGAKPLLLGNDRAAWPPHKEAT